MPYIQRDTLGQIHSLYRSDPGGAEFQPADDPEVINFLALGAAPAADFVRMDIDFVRVLEDVIDALIARNVISITDLPQQALDKLLARRGFRDRITQRLSGIIDAES